MRPKLDENLSATLVEPLRSLGHDADTVVLEGLQGAPDDQVVPAAAEADRLLITLDRGIGALALRLRPSYFLPGYGTCWRTAYCSAVMTLRLSTRSGPRTPHGGRVHNKTRRDSFPTRPKGHR